MQIAVSIKKVLLEHSHAHLVTYPLWVLSQVGPHDDSYGYRALLSPLSPFFFLKSLSS